MRKHIRKRKKQEVMILKLAIKKNIVTKKESKKSLYWESFNQTGKKIKYKTHSFPEYYQEYFFCTVDYWGEADEHCFTHMLQEHFTDWPDDIDDDDPWPQCPSRKELINILRSMKRLNTTMIKNL